MKTMRVRKNSLLQDGNYGGSVVFFLAQGGPAAVRFLPLTGWES
jgi:hypothetical protein